jgi:subtilase family serine protease
MAHGPSLDPKTNNLSWGTHMKTALYRVVPLMSIVFCLAFASAMPSHAASPEARKNVPLWVASATRVASAEDSQRVSIAVILSLKNQTALESLVAVQSNPRSAQYGSYLTPAQFHQRFAPDPADVARVQNTLKQLGFVVQTAPASGLIVQATGTVAQIKASFGVSQEIYSYKGKLLRANAETPTLPAQIAGVVAYVAGLDDTALLRKTNYIRLNDAAVPAAPAVATSGKAPSAPPPPQDGINSPVCSTYWYDHSAVLSTAPAPYPQALPWLMCGYTPQQLRAAYGANQVAQDGTGVRVGIVDVYASPTIVADTNRYSANHGLPKLTSSNYQQILPPGILNVPASDPCGPQGWYGEESLDWQAVHSMAPGAFILFEADTCTDPVNGPLYDLIDNHRADIVTNSYTYGGEALPADFIAAENQLFMQAAAEGMSLLFSSGDDGDQAAANGIASGSWDPTSPYVTGVGGTSLALVDSAGAKHEWGWGNYRAFLNNAMVGANGQKISTSGVALPFEFYAGSGGGPSLVMLAPDYQANVPYKLSAFTYLANNTLVPLEAPHRVTPDISMVGDPYTGFVYGETYAITGNPILDEGCKAISSVYEYCEEDIGGTSLSSPLFAGVLALVNEARFQNHKAAVGFVNPALYLLNVGEEGSAAPIIDVRAPTSPTAVLRGYLGDPTKVRVVTMNSTPLTSSPSTVVEGRDTALLTAPGYDNVTGLGTPNVPALIQAFDIL